MLVFRFVPHRAIHTVTGGKVAMDTEGTATGGTDTGPKCRGLVGRHTG